MKVQVVFMMSLLFLFSCASSRYSKQMERTGSIVEKCGVFHNAFTGDASRGIANIHSDDEAPNGILEADGDKYYLAFSRKLTSIDKMKISSWVDAESEEAARLCVVGKLARSDFTYRKILIEQAW